MRNLTIDQIIAKIQKGQCFEANATDGSLTIKIHEYAPYVCAAIHAGSRLRDELKDKIRHSEYDRWYEEDPFTDAFISSLPIVLIGNDSRFEYDLNRKPEIAVFDEAWGKKVWKRPLAAKHKAKSLEKHANFYRVTAALIEAIESRFEACVVYDIHSYNYKRHEKEQPVFNIGTENVDSDRWNKVIRYWKRALARIELPNIETTVEENGPFYGRGYFLEFITKRFSNTLVFATEVKKVYCDELTGEPFPLVINALKDEMKEAILATTAYFARASTNLTVSRKHHLLSSVLSQDLLNLDKQLYQLTKRFELLNYVNPVNQKQEKKRFFKHNFSINPDFHYGQLDINPFEFKRQLYALPVEKVRDITLQNLYKDVINAYADKVDMLASIGTDRFLFNSLRYFGQPNDADIANADFILSCPGGEEHPKNLSAEEARDIFETAVKQYGFKCKIEISKNTTAEAMVLNYQRTLRLKKGARFSDFFINALVHHEIGVHMVTTINATLQPLNIFKLGLPVNTKTQEGLAVLMEYMSGYITINRLKELALRVKAIDLMLNGCDFKTVFAKLVHTYHLSTDSAFQLCTRIFRGGGFTKDYLYLQGFREVLDFYRNGNGLDNLLIGKTSMKYLPALNEMVNRKILLPPKYRPPVLETPANPDPILKFVIDGIKE